MVRIVKYGPGWKMSDDGRFKLPHNYNPSNPQHRANAKTIAFAQDKSSVAADYSVPDMGIHNAVASGLAAGIVTTVAPPAYVVNQARMGAKGLANKMGRTPSGLTTNEKKRTPLIHRGQTPFWEDANKLGRSIGNVVGAREPSGLKEKEKVFAKANPSHDFLSTKQREYLNNRRTFKGGRRLITNKRKSCKKSKGRKTLHNRNTRKSNTKTKN
jgi:hypothetical protein